MADSESTVRITIEVDDSAVDTAISSISELQDTTATVTIEADTSSLDDAVIPFEELDGETVTPTIDVQETDTGKETTDAIKMIAAIEVIRLTIDIIGTALDFLKAFKDFAVQPLLDIDTAVAHINAQTGNAIPNARELLNTLYPKDIGDIDAIASALTHARQLGLPLEEATTAALEFVKVFPENDPNAVLDALDQMVKNKLAPDITTAADLLTTAQQNGINKGNDLISVFDRSSTAIKNLGLTGDEFLALASADLEGGGASAQTFLDTLTKIKTGLQSGSKNSTDALAILGIPDPTTTGQGYTDDFFKSVASAIANYKGTDAEKQALFQALVGGKLGQKDYEGFLNIASAQPSLDALTNATSIAATEMDDSLMGAIDDFVLAAQVAAMDFLSSDQIDLPGKIEALKTGLQDALAVLQGGGDLEEALTVGLKPIGWDDEFQRLEAIFGNFIVSLLGVIASIQDVLNQPEAAAATRSEQGRLAQQQLAYNLKIANPDEISQDVKNAVANGVDPEGVTAAVGTAVSELVGQGAFDQAQQLVDTFSSQMNAVVQGHALGGGVLSEVTIPITPEMSYQDLADQVAAAEKKLIDAGAWTADFKVENVDVDQDAVASWQAQINTATEEAARTALSNIDPSKIDKGKEWEITPTITPMSSTSTPGLISPEALQLQSDEADKTTARINDMATGVTDLGTKSTTATDAITTANTAITEQTMAEHGHGSAVDTTTASIRQNTDATIKHSSQVEQLAGITSDASVATQDAGVQMQNLSDATHDFATNAAQAVQIMHDAAASANSGTAESVGKGGDTTAHPGKKASGGTFSGMSWVGEEGPELVSTDTSLAVLNSRTSAAIMAALSGAAGRGSTTNYGGNKNVNLTQINNVQSMAQADALGYRTAETIRGV